MDLHSGKLQLLNIRSNTGLQADMVYSGALISDNGHLVWELTRRGGNARSDFWALSKVWRHSGLSCSRKTEIYTNIGLSKLKYGLSTTWLNV
eukprot:741698-Pyramimonas_sp.AAC.1